MVEIEVDMVVHSVVQVVHMVVDHTVVHQEVHMVEIEVDHQVVHMEETEQEVNILYINY